MLPYIADECLEFAECIVVKCVKAENKSHGLDNLFVGKSIDRKNINFIKSSECKDSIIRDRIIKDKLDRVI